MSIPTLTSMPAEFSAGTTVTLLRTMTDYPPGTWTLTAYLAGPGVAQAVGVAEGTGHRLTFTAAVTTGLPAGVYTYVERVSADGPVVHDVLSMRVTVLPDLATAAAGDLTGWAEKTLPIVEAAIAGRLPRGMDSFSIAGRAVSKIPIVELVSLRNKLASMVNIDRAGGRISRSHRVTFTDD